MCTCICIHKAYTRRTSCHRDGIADCACVSDVIYGHGTGRTGRYNNLRATLQLYMTYILYNDNMYNIIIVCDVVDTKIM